MLAALLTAFLFSLSAVAGRRIAISMGGLRANTTRLALALVFLLAILWLSGSWAGVRPAAGWLAVSGLVGFGLGDVALYLALVRIGSRLTTLLVFCVGPLVGAAAEFFWLGERTGLAEVLCILGILAGLALVLRPDPAQARASMAGVAWGVVAGLGQALGAVLTRRANTLLSEGDPEVWDGLAQAAVRVAAGLPVAVLAMLLVTQLRPRAKGAATVPFRRLFPWILGAALCGPVLGVGCFQWALFDLPSGIVLAVVALVPIFVLPWAYLLEGDRPRRGALVGTAVAVAGVAALALV